MGGVMGNSMKSFRTSAGAWLLLLFAALPAHGQETKPAGKGIDPATVAAYEKIGGHYGGWQQDTGHFTIGAEHAANGLPGFSFVIAFSNHDLPTGAKLPDAAVPFGLVLRPSARVEGSRMHR